MTLRPSSMIYNLTCISLRGSDVHVWIPPHNCVSLMQIEYSHGFSQPIKIFNLGQKCIRWMHFIYIKKIFIFHIKRNTFIINTNNIITISYFSFYFILSSLNCGSKSKYPTHSKHPNNPNTPNDPYINLYYMQMLTSPIHQQPLFINISYQPNYYQQQNVEFIFPWIIMEWYC